MTDRFAVAVDSSLRQRASKLAAKLNLRTQTHLNEQAAEKRFIERELYPDAKSYTDVYLDDGLLDHRCILAHCIHMRDDEWSIARDSDSVVAHCPTSNLLLGSGTMSLEAVKARGLPYAIATDVGASPTVSMLAEMGRFLDVHQGRSTSATPAEALYRSTRAPAEILGIADRVGVLEVGRPMSFIEVTLRASPRRGTIHRRRSDSWPAAQRPSTRRRPTCSASLWLAALCLIESSPMRDHLIVFINGQTVRVTGDDAFLSLSDFLRKRRHLTGTKVVCAEGDCGSCSVLVGRLDGDKLKYVAVTSCIQRVFQLDGAHIITVEGLRDGEQLSPIQQAMVKCHGAQCGFCTPGFVVALSQLANDRVEPTRENACRALVGNLCRCTGYDAILRAATSIDYGAVKSLETRYDSAEMRSDMHVATQEDVLLKTPLHRVYKPATLTQALKFRAESPHATIVAGGTDWGVLINKRVREISGVLALFDVRELHDITVDASAVHVGATATLTEFEHATLDAIPALGEFLSWFGSPPIKNAGTLAGNLATGSPIGDSLPAMMVLGAEIELASITGRRRVKLTDFYTGYRQNVMRSDELIVAIHVPRLKADETLKLYKVSKRKDLDISSVSAAIFLKQQGDTIVDARIAIGGVGATVTRITAAEDSLRGGRIELSRFENAANIIRDAVKPISDVRGSADYRRALAGNLILKCFHELVGEATAGGTR